MKAKESNFKSTVGGKNDLTRGVLLGTVETHDCTWNGERYNWHLRNPQRATKCLIPTGRPQPVWF